MTEPGSTAETRRPVWICPNCGARLISKNLWHSCGNFTIADLFAGARPGVVELARKYVSLLQSLGDVQVIPQKTAASLCRTGSVRRLVSA